MIEDSRSLSSRIALFNWGRRSSAFARCRLNLSVLGRNDIAVRVGEPRDGFTLRGEAESGLGLTTDLP